MASQEIDINILMKLFDSFIEIEKERTKLSNTFTIKEKKDLLKLYMILLIIKIIIIFTLIFY